jgi:hypothetical protein
MTTTTRKASKAEPAAPPTFAAIAAKRMADAVVKYREHVARAAAGEQLDAGQLTEAVETLALMGLPEYAWERDVQAHRDYLTLSKAQAEARAKAPASEARAAELVERIKALENELKAARTEHYTLASVEPATRVGYGQRIGELELNHPHLFADVSTAVQLRTAAKAKAAGHAPAPITSSPITTGAWGQ